MHLHCEVNQLTRLTTDSGKALDNFKFWEGLSRLKGASLQSAVSPN